MNYVNLHRHIGAKRACLREISGLEEQSVGDTTTATAIRLIDQLLSRLDEGDLLPKKAVDLVVTDRDSLLGAVYEQLYGPTIETKTDCFSCKTPFEISFQLADILNGSVGGTQDDMPEQDLEGFFRLNKHCRFRLPTGRDEISIRRFQPQEAEQVLLSRCIVEGDLAKYADDVQEKLQKLAPVCDLDLSASCPECQSTQSAHFNLQSYLLTALVQERPRLVREIHRLASTYSWSLNEILRMRRSQRRAFVELVESESIFNTKRDL